MNNEQETTPWTPEPLTVHFEGKDEFWFSKGYYSIEGESFGDDRAIPVGVSIPNAKQWATLLAAAPEMAEALSAVLERLLWWNGFERDTELYPEDEKAIVDARELLARIRGDT